MSAITPEVSETSNRAPAFNRPVAPAPNLDRDNELLTYYFDSTWTTKDIAEHFKLSVAVVAAWFQRPDIAALIDFITASSERRARDIARENLPGTIDILLRISRLRNDDKVSRAASSALITFARGRANYKSAAKLSSTASARSRNATSSPPRDLHHNPNTRDADSYPQSPGRDADSLDAAQHADTSPPVMPDSAGDATNPPSSFNRLDDAIAPRFFSPGTPADLLARAGSANGQPLTSEQECDLPLPLLTTPDMQPSDALRLPAATSSPYNSCAADRTTPERCKASA